MNKEKQPLLHIYWYSVQFAIYLTYFLILLYIVGFDNNNAIANLHIVDNYAKMIVSLFLMWKFNFFRKKTVFTDLDRSIVFQCAFFLFLTTPINTFVISYLMIIKQYIQTFIQKFKKTIS